MDEVLRSIRRFTSRFCASPFTRCGSLELHDIRTIRLQFRQRCVAVETAVGVDRRGADGRAVENLVGAALAQRTLAQAEAAVADGLIAEIDQHE